MKNRRGQVKKERWKTLGNTTKLQQKKYWRREGDGGGRERGEEVFEGENVGVFIAFDGPLNDSKRRAKQGSLFCSAPDTNHTNLAGPFRPFPKKKIK